MIRMFFDIMKNIKYRDEETLYIIGNKRFAAEIALEYRIHLK